MSLILLWGMLLLPLFFIDPMERRRDNQRGGCLGVMAALPSMALGSVILAAPAALLEAEDRMKIQRQWLPWVVIIAAPLVALGLAVLLSPLHASRRTRFIRATILLAAVPAAERLAMSADVPVSTKVGPAILIAFVTTAACTGAWRLTDRFYRPDNPRADLNRRTGRRAISAGRRPRPDVLSRSRPSPGPTSRRRSSRPE